MVRQVLDVSSTEVFGVDYTHTFQEQVNAMIYRTKAVKSHFRIAHCIVWSQKNSMVGAMLLEFNGFTESVHDKLVECFSRRKHGIFHKV